MTITCSRFQTPQSSTSNSRTGAAGGRRQPPCSAYRQPAHHPSLDEGRGDHISPRERGGRQVAPWPGDVQWEVAAEGAQRTCVLLHSAAPPSPLLPADKQSLRSEPLGDHRVLHQRWSSATEHPRVGRQAACEGSTSALPPTSGQHHQLLYRGCGS